MSSSSNDNTITTTTTNIMHKRQKISGINVPSIETVRNAISKSKQLVSTPCTTTQTNDSGSDNATSGTPQQHSTQVSLPTLYNSLGTCIILFQHIISKTIDFFFTSNKSQQTIHHPLLPSHQIIKRRQNRYGSHQREKKKM